MKLTFFLPIAILLFLFSGLVSQGQTQSRADRTRTIVASDPKAKWWRVMDTGPFISDTFRLFASDGEIGVLKGVALKVGAKEDYTMLFDTETMRMVAWIQRQCDSRRDSLGWQTWRQFFDSG